MVSLKPHPMNFSGRLINRRLISTTIVDMLSAIDAGVDQKNKKPTHTHLYIYIIRMTLRP